MQKIKVQLNILLPKELGHSAGKTSCSCAYYCKVVNKKMLKNNYWTAHDKIDYIFI